MRNADYWRQRARINSDAAHADANEYIARLEDIYREAVMSVQADLDRWFGRFADNNQITLAEAKKRLTEGELEEFHWSVDKYIKAAEEHGLDPAWQKKLENASARYHISRLEAIQTQIQQQAELVYGNQTDGLDELLRRVADNGYNHAAFDVMKGVGMGWDFTKLDQKRLDAMLKKPWTSDGKTFTDRCWEGKADLIDGIQRELVQSLMRGDSLVKTRDHIAQRFGVSKYKAGRLAHTEATYFNAVSTQACYEDLGVEKIEILETLDKHTCEICAAMDGKVIDKKDYQPGVTVPPFHPNCRGTTCPWFDDMEDVGQRIARDNEGEVYYVPPDMTYREWEKTFQEGGPKNKYRAILDGSWDNGPITASLNSPRITNDDTTVTRFMESLEYDEDDSEIRVFIEQSVRHMPPDDLNMLSGKLIVRRTTDSNSFVSEHLEAGKDGVLKHVIKLNPKSGGPFTFAHECAHCAEEMNGLYGDVEFRQVLDHFGKSITGLGIGEVNGDYYVIGKSPLTIEPYQGRTYVRDLGRVGPERIVELDDFVEYISVGYECFVGDPDYLDRVDPMLYNYFKKRGLT